METYKKICENLTKVVEAHKVNVSDLARRMKVTRKTIYKWMNGEVIMTLPHYFKLQELLQVDLTQLKPRLEERRTSDIENLHDYQRVLRECLTYDDMIGATQMLFRQYQIDNFIYLQIYRGDLSPEPTVVVLTDLSDKWRKHYRSSLYHKHDITWDYCLNAVLPVYSEDLYAEARKRNDVLGMEMYDELRKYGYAYSVAVPVHGPCCQGAYIAFVNKLDKAKIIKEKTPVLVNAAVIFYNAVHELMELKDNMSVRRKLRPSHQEIIRDIVGGKSALEIAERIGISESAVRKRITRLMEELSVDNRQSLVLALVSQSLIPRDMGNYNAYSKPFNTHIPHARPEIDVLETARFSERSARRDDVTERS